MPSNRRQQTVQSPVSGPSKATSKYINRDASKFITVPKGLTNIQASEISPAMAHATTKTNGQVSTAPDINGAPTVNRKKAKRREKEAAKRRAAELEASSQANGTQSSCDVKRRMQELGARFREHSLEEPYEDNDQFHHENGDGNPYDSDEVDGFSGSYGPNGSPPNRYTIPPSNTSGKKSKKKKKSKGAQSQGQELVHANDLSYGQVGLPLPPLGPTSLPRGPGISKEKIWNTSSQEERERIKEFWLSLGEDDRKSLVKVEKDAVLKKMKEQQKHSCSCTVCGRKRTAIEEELEVLYDAYYEELEQYANHQVDGGRPMMPPPRRFGAIGGLQPPNRIPPTFNPQQPSRGRIIEQLGDDEDDEGEGEGDEEYSEDDADEDDYSDDEPEEPPRSNATDFFNFGNSLTVQGGILTVADDLLKNDGKKFIEMMEQLAERRMAREEDAREQFSNPNYGPPQNGTMHTHPHNHPPPPDDVEYEEEEEEEDYDSQDEDYDEEEMDTMTEEQRMEEGRRMFQIFAARMFEQRVLTAYKKKVSEERTQRLLEELEEENKAKSEKQAKKARDAQKKKEKLAQKKQALAEEKARREAEEAEKLAAIRAAEEKKAEEARARAEERRKKKEAQKKAEEEERARKEAEKARRLQEQRERQAEQERKQREAKERERREKDEQRHREREAKEAREREAKERREKQEQEKLEMEIKANTEREAKEKLKREEVAAQNAAQAALNATNSSKRGPVSIPASLQPHPIASPHIPIAIPAIPKAPTPIKLRVSSSQQESIPSIPQTPQTSGLSHQDSPVASTPMMGSPSAMGLPSKAQNQHPFLHQPQASSPMHAALKSPDILQQPNPLFGSMQSINGALPFPPVMPMMTPGFPRMQHEPMFPPQGMGAQFRPLIGPNGLPIPMNMHQMPQGRGFPMPHVPPGFPQHIPNGLGGIGQAFGGQKDGPGSESHSRQQSGTFESPGAQPQAQPIARPAPIGRPASVVHGQRHGDMKNDIEDLSNHLGSSALLDDSDEALVSGASARRSSVAPRQNFVPPFGIGTSGFVNQIANYNGWGAPQNPFGSSSLPDSNYMVGWPPVSFGALNGPQKARPPPSRPVGVRLMICRACKNLEGSTHDGFYDLITIKDQVDQMNPTSEQPVSEKELLDICETEGNAVNGGGSFDIHHDGKGHYSIRYENETPPPPRPIGAPGEIGSPIMGNGGMARFPTSHPPGF